MKFVIEIPDNVVHQWPADVFPEVLRNAIIESNIGRVTDVRRHAENALPPKAFGCSPALAMAKEKAAKEFPVARRLLAANMDKRCGREPA